MGFIASIVEAYGEFRVNKGRILLSLVGVAFSVFAMTGMLGAGGMLGSALQQSVEREMGRAATLTIQPESTPTGDDVARADRVVDDVLDRAGITHRSRMSQSSLRVQTGAGVRTVNVTAVDPEYATMYRIRVGAGRWLADNDGARLTPAIVVDDLLWNRLGRPTPGAAVLTAYGAGGSTTRLLLVGVTPPAPGNDEPMPGMQSTVYVHADAADTLGADSSTGMPPSYLAWVPPDDAETVSAQLGRMLSTTPAGSFMVDNNSVGDLGFDELQKAVLVAASIMLILGAMGLVNIALVTVRYRMREIGIRRSYGATGPRIFFGVLMESVVATTIAGIVGVTGAVALLKAPLVRDFFRDQGLVDLPPFPLSAVVTGLVAAVLVGALAGIIPALIATRIKVIDAIRA